MMEQLPSTPSVADIARSTLFDYEVRGRPARYRVFYDFLKLYTRLFEQPWRTTSEIEECLTRLAAVDGTDDDPSYAAYAEGLRYQLTDAFYSANKPGMDLLCRTYREFVKENNL